MSSASINKRQIEALIKCGAFDSLGVYRSRLLASYEKMIDSENGKNSRNVGGQTDIFSFFQNESASINVSGFEYPEIPEFTAKEKLLMEKEVSGMYFSGNLLDDYTEELSRISSDSIADIIDAGNGDYDSSSASEYIDGARVCIAGIITKVTAKTTKAGDRMAFIKIEDRFGEIEAIVFPKKFSAFSYMLRQDNAVCVNGMIKQDGSEEPRIAVNTIRALSPNGSSVPQKTQLKVPRETPKKVDEQEEESQPKKLYVRVNAMNDPKVSRAISIIKANPGELEVIIYDAQAKRSMRATNASSVAQDRSVIELLGEILGKENVIIK